MPKSQFAAALGLEYCQRRSARMEVYRWSPAGEGQHSLDRKKPILQPISVCILELLGVCVLGSFPVFLTTLPPSEQLPIQRIENKRRLGCGRPRLLVTGLGTQAECAAIKNAPVQATSILEVSNFEAA